MVDHTQADPFAHPSRCRVQLSMATAGFPPVRTTPYRSRRGAPSEGWVCATLVDHVGDVSLDHTTGATLTRLSHALLVIQLTVPIQAPSFYLGYSDTPLGMRGCKETGYLSTSRACSRHICAGSACRVTFTHSRYSFHLRLSHTPTAEGAGMRVCWSRRRTAARCGVSRCATTSRAPSRTTWPAPVRTSAQRAAGEFQPRLVHFKDPFQFPVAFQGPY